MTSPQSISWLQSDPIFMADWAVVDTTADIVIIWKNKNKKIY